MDQKFLPSINRKRSFDETRSNNEKWNEQMNHQKYLASIYQQQQQHQYDAQEAPAEIKIERETPVRSSPSGVYFPNNLNYYSFDTISSLLNGNDYYNSGNKLSHSVSGSNMAGKMAPPLSSPQNQAPYFPTHPISGLPVLDYGASNHYPQSSSQSADTNASSEENAANNLSYLANYSSYPNNYPRPYSYELPHPNIDLATKQLLNMRNSSAPPPSHHTVAPSRPKKPSVGLTIMDVPSAEVLNQPITVFRNLFHTVYCSMTDYDPRTMDGQRVYIEPRVGYSGNATRFKKVPDPDEKAFILNVNIYDPQKNLVEQCKICKEYYDHQRYFKSSPDALGKIVLVKNNAPIRIDRDGFKIAMKVMCACTHNNVDYFQCVITLRRAGETQISHSASINLFSKQWRKSNQKKEDLNLNFYPTEDSQSNSSYNNTTTFDSNTVELPFPNYQPPSKSQLMHNTLPVLAENSA